jgi:hypothetical protein
MSLSRQLSWIDQAMNSSSHSNLAGFSLWAYDRWSTNDFTAWANWPTKGSVPSLTFSLSEATFIAVVIIAIVAAVAVLLFRKKAKNKVNDTKAEKSIDFRTEK